MAISIKGKLADKAIELLGGRNVTEKRVEGLLAELAEARAALAELKGIQEGSATPPPYIVSSEVAAKAVAEAFGHADVQPERPRSPQDGELGGMAVPVLNLGIPDDDLDTPTEEDPKVLARHLEVQPLPDVNMRDPDIRAANVHLSAEMQMMQSMMAKMEAMGAEIAALKVPPTEDDKKKAMAEGKLPAVVTTAAPIGYTGSAQLPRGRWFPSPLGPSHIQIRLCDCQQCTAFRVHHYFCCVCKRGPFLYAGQQGPKGRKQYTAPGSTWGITHEACSVTCYMRYLEAIGVAPGVNDAEPPSTSPTEQPMVALGSD